MLWQRLKFNDIRGLIKFKGEDKKNVEIELDAVAGKTPFTKNSYT